MPILTKPKSHKLRKKLQRIGMDARNLDTWCIILGRTPSEVLCLSDVELVSYLKKLVEYIKKHQAIHRLSRIPFKNLRWANDDYSYVSMQPCPVRLFAGGPRGLDDTWSDDEKQIDISRGAPHLELTDSDDSFNVRRRPPLANQSTPIRPKSPSPVCPISPKTQNFAGRPKGLDETWDDDAKNLEFSRAPPNLQFSDSDDSFNARRRRPASLPINQEPLALACPISPKSQHFDGGPIDQDEAWGDEANQLEFSHAPPHLEFYDSDDSFNAGRRPPLPNQSLAVSRESPAQLTVSSTPTPKQVVNTTARTPQYPTTSVDKPRWLDYSWSDSKQLDFERIREPPRLEFSDPEDSFDEFKELPWTNQSTPIRGKSPRSPKQNIAQTNAMHELPSPKQATMPAAKSLVTLQHPTTPAGRRLQGTPRSRSFVMPRRIFDDSPGRRNQTMPAMTNDPTLNRSSQQQIEDLSTKTMQGSSIPKQVTSPAARSQGTLIQTTTPVDKPRWLDDTRDSNQRNREAAQVEYFDPDDSFNMSRQFHLANQSTSIRPESPVPARQHLQPTNITEKTYTQGTAQQTTVPVYREAQGRARSHSFAAPRKIFEDAPERRNRTMPDMNMNVALNQSDQQQKLRSMVQSFEKAVDDFKKNNQRSPSVPPRPSLPHQYPSPIPPPPRFAGPYQYPVPSPPPPLAMIPYQYPTRPSIGSFQYPATPQIPDYHIGDHPFQFHPYRQLWDEFPSHYQHPQARPSAVSPMSSGACGANGGVSGCTCSNGGKGKAQNDTMGGYSARTTMNPFGPPVSPARPLGSPRQPTESRVQSAETGGMINISLIGEDGENAFTVPLPRGVVLSIQVP